MTRIQPIIHFICGTVMLLLFYELTFRSESKKLANAQTVTLHVSTERCHWVTQNLPNPQERSYLYGIGEPLYRHDEIRLFIDPNSPNTEELNIVPGLTQDFVEFDAVTGAEVPPNPNSPPRTTNFMTPPVFAGAQYFGVGAGIAGGLGSGVLGAGAGLVIMWGKFPSVQRRPDSPMTVFRNHPTFGSNYRKIQKSNHTMSTRPILAGRSQDMYDCGD